MIFVGGFQGTSDAGGGALTSAGGLDAFVAKLTIGGSHVWSLSFGDSAEQIARHVLVATSGDVIVAGTFANTIDLGGETLSSVGGDDIFIAVLTR